MSALLAATREAAALSLAILRRRPGMMALFVAIQLASNLVRLWIGAVGAGSMFLVAVGGVFLFVRIFITQWLHVATARLGEDTGISARDAFRVAPNQALWFHGLVVVSGAAFLIRRLWLDQLAGGFFAPSGIGHLSTLIGLALGFLVSYLMFLPFIPGYFAALLGPWQPSLRWSLEGVRGQLMFSLATVMLLAMPVAIVRRWVFDWLGSATWEIVLTIATLDAALTVLLMVIATAVYLQCYHRALERMGPPDRGSAAVGR